MKVGPTVLELSHYGQICFPCLYIIVRSVTILLALTLVPSLRPSDEILGKEVGRGGETPRYPLKLSYKIRDYDT